MSFTHKNGLETRFHLDPKALRIRNFENRSHLLGHLLDSVRPSLLLLHRTIAGQSHSWQWGIEGAEWKTLL